MTFELNDMQKEIDLSYDAFLNLCMFVSNALVETFGYVFFINGYIN